MTPGHKFSSPELCKGCLRMGNLQGRVRPPSGADSDKGFLLHCLLTLLKSIICTPPHTLQLRVSNVNCPLLPPCTALHNAHAQCKAEECKVQNNPLPTATRYCPCLAKQCPGPCALLPPDSTLKLRRHSRFQLLCDYNSA